MQKIEKEKTNNLQLQTREIVPLKWHGVWRRVSFVFSVRARDVHALECDESLIRFLQNRTSVVFRTVADYFPDALVDFDRTINWPLARIWQISDARNGLIGKLIGQIEHSTGIFMQISIVDFGWFPLLHQNFKLALSFQIVQRDVASAKGFAVGHNVSTDVHNLKHLK